GHLTPVGQAKCCCCPDVAQLAERQTRPCPSGPSPPVRGPRNWRSPRSPSSPRSPNRCGGFSTLSGPVPAACRPRRPRPGFLGGILDYVSGDEGLLVAFAADAGIDPTAIETARQLLSEG